MHPLCTYINRIQKGLAELPSKQLDDPLSCFQYLYQRSKAGPENPNPSSLAQQQKDTKRRRFTQDHGECMSGQIDFVKPPEAELYVVNEQMQTKKRNKIPWLLITTKLPLKYSKTNSTNPEEIEGRQFTLDCWSSQELFSLAKELMLFSLLPPSHQHHLSNYSSFNSNLLLISGWSFNYRLTL